MGVMAGPFSITVGRSGKSVWVLQCRSFSVHEFDHASDASSCKGDRDYECQQSLLYRGHCYHDVRCQGYILETNSFDSEFDCDRNEVLVAITLNFVLVQKC